MFCSLHLCWYRRVAFRKRSLHFFGFVNICSCNLLVIIGITFGFLLFRLFQSRQLLIDIGRVWVILAVRYDAYELIVFVFRLFVLFGRRNIHVLHNSVYRWFVDCPLSVEHLNYLSEVSLMHLLQSTVPIWVLPLAFLLLEAISNSHDSFQPHLLNQVRQACYDTFTDCQQLLSTEHRVAIIQKRMV